jgi:hypothetical protein
MAARSRVVMSNCCISASQNTIKATLIFQSCFPHSKRTRSSGICARSKKLGKPGRIAGIVPSGDRASGSKRTSGAVRSKRFRCPQCEHLSERGSM